MANDKKKVETCEFCLQPTTVDYKFELSYYESGEKVTKYFCGSTCLRQWIDKELDRLHLDLFSLEEE